MADESAITLAKAAAAQLAGTSILPMIALPDGVAADYRLNFASVLPSFYKIAPSVASNNLTVAIQHLDGSAPSTNAPMGFKIGDSWLLATGALSTTKNAATNWCAAGGTGLAANPIDFFVYVLNETGASAGIKILFSRIPYARTMADFVNTSTDEKYPAGSWTNFNATDEVANIGRFRAQLSATASFNWSIASALVIARPIYETGRLAFSPTWVGWTTPPTVALSYMVRGSICDIYTIPTGSSASNSTSTTMTMPFTCATIASLVARVAATGQDNGVVLTSPSMLTLASATITAVWYKDFGGTAWTGSGTKQVFGTQMSYPLA